MFCHNVNYLEILPVNRKYWLKHSRNFQISDSTWIPDIKIGWTKWYTQHYNDDTLQSGCYFDTYSSRSFLKNVCTSRSVVPINDRTNGMNRACSGNPILKFQRER